MAIQFNKNNEENTNYTEKESTHMSITLEQIDLIMKRMNVTYTEAKEALEASNGDVVEALALLERKGKSADRSKKHVNTEQFTTYANTLKTTHFVLSKNNHNYVHAPLLAVLIGMVLCFHISVIALVAALLFGFKIKLTDEVTQTVRFSNDDFMNKF